MKRLALMLACAVVPGVAAAGLLGPSNYEECVLKHLQGVSSDVGARMVAAACASQFPPKKPTAKSAAPTTSGQGDRRGSSDSKPGEFTNFVPGPAK